MTTSHLSLRLEDTLLGQLENIANYQDKTTSAVIRTALKNYILEEQRRANPLGLQTAQTLSAYLGMDAPTLVESSSYLEDYSASSLPGVYLLINTDTNELYVGSTTDLNRRFIEHSSKMTNTKHKNKSLKSWSASWTVAVVLCELDRNTPDLVNTLRREEQVILEKLSGINELTVVNLATAFNSESTHKERQLKTKETHTKQEVLTESLSAALEVEEEPTGYSSGMTHDEFIELYCETEVLPILDEANNSKDLVYAVERAGYFGELELGWCVDFIKAQESPWLDRLMASGRFPQLNKLFA